MTLVKIEVVTMQGNGKLDIRGTGSNEVKEDIKNTYNYIRANERSLMASNGAIERATNFSDRVSLLSESGAKTVLVPMDNVIEVSSLPATILGKSDISFYASAQMLIQKIA